MNHKRAFTLIELLVVLAIIGLLMTITIPLSLKGIELARRASCANNLKALGVAFNAYATDHKGALPHYNPLPAAGGSFQEVADFSAIAVKLYTNGYVTDLRLWICPSDKEDFGRTAVKPARSINEFKSVGNCSYMYISGYHLLRTVENPTVAPIMCDESNQREYGPATPGKMPKIGPNDNHGANVRNVLFLAGHVITYKDADASNAIFDNLVNTDVLCSVD